MLFQSSGSFFTGLPQPVAMVRKKQVRDKVFKYPFRLLVAKKRAEKGKTKAVMPSKMLNEVAESIVPDWAGVLRNVPQAARLLDVNESRKDKADIFNKFILPNRSVSDAAKKFLKKLVNEFTFSDNLEPIDIKTDRSLERYRLMSGGHDLESDLRDGRIIRNRSEPLETIMTRIFSNDRLDQAARSGHSSSDLAELIRKVYNTSDDQEKAIDEFLRQKMKDRANERQALEARQTTATAARQEQDRINAELASLRSANSVFTAPTAPRLDATGRLAFSDTSSNVGQFDDVDRAELSQFDPGTASFNDEETAAWAQQQQQAEQAAEEVGPPPEADQMSQQAIIPDALPVASADALIPSVSPATTTQPSVATEPAVTDPVVVDPAVDPEPVFDEQEVMQDLAEMEDFEREQGIELSDSETDEVAPLANNPSIIQTQEGAANVTGAAQDTNTAVLGAPPQIANSDIPIAELKPDINVVESQMAGLPVGNPVREEVLGVEDQPTGPQAAGAGQIQPLSSIEQMVATETQKDIPAVRDAVMRTRAEYANTRGAPPTVLEADRIFLKPAIATSSAEEARKYLIRYYSAGKQQQNDEFIQARADAIKLLRDEKIIDEATEKKMGGKTKNKVDTLIAAEPDEEKRRELIAYRTAKTEAYPSYAALAK
jgi:hypothetical protein